MISLVSQITSYQPISCEFGLSQKIWASLSILKNRAIPEEENRIFLFLDLNNSTAIAERMGHVEYSMFLSRFFKDFKTCVRRTKGQIYQYVGDEVIVSWPSSQQNINESVMLVNQFRQLLNESANTYKNKFNCIPAFKAALHQGKVAVSRIGIKKVYRGDVMNTCARMLDIASQYKISLVMSPAVAEDVNEQKNCFIELDNVAIRGKAEPMKIYAVK